MVKKADITPDKSLIQKLGLTGYRTEQAIAELLDNSIDARISNKVEEITVQLSPEEKMIRVTDNGCGMNDKDLINAMTIAKGTKSAGKLGQFGMGMKSACSALGKNFIIATSETDSDKEYQIEYDEDRWLSDESKNWQNFEISEKTLNNKEQWHGTIITIKKLRVPIYPNQVSKFKESFGIRYAPYLESNQIFIQINTVFCKPEKPEMIKESMTKVRIKLSRENKICGHVALLKKRSIKGHYGIHLLKNGRLIKAHEKFGFSAHPENAKIIGELNLDHVPVNFNKSEFIKESSEYREVLEAFKASPELKEALHQSQSKKEITASVESVFDYFNDFNEKSSSHQQYYLDGSVRSKIAVDILNKTPKLGTKIGNNPVEIRLESMENAPLYVTSKNDSGIVIAINKGHNAFRFVKNPLFLIGMIASEVKLLAMNSDFDNIMQQRNQSFDKFMQEWSKKPVKKEEDFRDREIKLPNISNYKLVDELFGLHDYLKEKIGFKFQFTALSTLATYLHNLRGKIVYAIYTESQKGEYLADILSEEFGSKFTIIHKPDLNTLNALLKISTTNRIIAIREYSVIKGSTIATPEKAYLDLLNEVVTHYIPLDKTELRRIFSTMQRYNLIDYKKLRTYSNFIKKTNTLENILGDKLQW